MKVLRRPTYYVGAPAGFTPAPCHQWLIDTCAEAAVPDPAYFDQVRALSPDKPKCFAYNSGTDDYVSNSDGSTHGDFLRVKACADQLGVPIETMYLHWAEDTAVTWWISGSGPQPYSYAAGSRIEMYAGAHQSGGATRQLCSFMPAARPVQTKAMLQVAEAVSPGGHKWDGLLLDNCGSVLYNWGDPLVSGGTVLECGFKIGSPNFQQWYWTNLRMWLVEFRSAMHALTPPRLVAMNTSNSWVDEYCTLPTADRFEQEFVGNPIRDSWPSILEMARRHQLAQSNGVGLWMSASPQLGNPNETWEEMQYAALCLYLAVQEPLSSTHIQDWTGPYSPSPADPSWWPKRVVSPVEANHQFTLLGNPTGKVELIETRGPSTRQQHLYRRMYEGGAVYCRNLEPYNGLTTETWDVTRGPQMFYIGPDGVNSKPASVAIKNGGGAIFVRA
jgi:hypothetical protein